MAWASVVITIGFDEVEFSDHALSSGVGWTLKVRAMRSAPLRGGVLADAVGAGKTINAIALIASRAKEARKGVADAWWKCPKDLQHSGAALVVAPVFCLKPVWNSLEQFSALGSEIALGSLFGTLWGHFLAWARKLFWESGLELSGAHFLVWARKSFQEMNLE